MSDYTEAINLLACYQGLPHPVKHGKSCSYPIIALFVTHFQIRGDSKCSVVIVMQILIDCESDLYSLAKKASDGDFISLFVESTIKPV